MLPFEQDSVTNELPFEQAQNTERLPFEEGPSWGEVGRSLPAQARAAFSSTGASLRKMGVEERIQQRTEAPLASGFAETDAGAATGLARPGAVSRQRQNLEQDIADRGVILAEAEQARKELKAATPQDMSFWQQVASSVVTSAPPTLAGLAAGIATRNPWLAMGIAGGGGSAMQGASTYEEALEKGATHRQAGRAGGIDAILEGVGEAIPLRYALKPGTAIGKRIFGTIAQEAGQEAATQAMQDLHAFLTYNPDITLQEAWDNIKVAGASGAVMGGLVGGLAHAADSSRKPVEEGQLGPSGEMVYGGNMENISPPKTPPVPNIPRPVPTQPVTTEAQALIASIDATLADPEAISNDQVEAAKQQIAAFEKARNAPPLAENTPLLAGLDDIRPALELGQSAKSTRNAPNYAPNPNDELPRSQRVVSYSTAQGVETGLSLAQTPLRPGVFVVGEPSSDREAPVLQAAADTLEQWRAKFLPDRPLLLMNETLPYGNAVGWHWTNGNVHAITPAALRKFVGQGSDAFNANAQVTFFYNLSHEFGHSLLEDRFFNEGIPQDLTQALKSESSQGVVSEGTLAALEAIDPARAAVVREYNSIRQRVMADQMTAREFQLEWLGPHQAGRRQMFGEHDYAMSVPDEAPALQLIDKIMQRAVGSKTPLPSDQLNAMRADYLSLHEYAANQTARYAYARKWDESSPFNKDSLFARAFQSLRDALAEFFAFLKREGDIAPNTTFAQWLDGLSTSGDRTTRAGKKARAPKAPKKAPKAAKAKPVEQLDHNVETVSEDKVKYFRSLVTGLVRNKTLEVGDETYKRLMGLLKAGDYSTFIDEIQPMLEKKVRFELDDDMPELKAGADLNRMIDLVGYKMYEAGLGNTIIKETLQNSVDAVLDQMKVDSALEGEINFAVDPKERTITVVDNGKGMTLQDVATKFLQLGAKGKEAGSAGGFGLAKAAFLFGPERILLETVRNGQKTSLEATQQDLRAQKDLRKQATIEKTNAPNGTFLKVWLPREYTSGTGEKRTIYMPSSGDLESMRMLAPITVTWQGPRNSWGDTPSEVQTLPVGKNFDLSVYNTPVEVTFAWGKALLYIGRQRQKYGGDHYVLSRGVPQFRRTFYEKDYEHFKKDLLIDIQPTVEAAHRLYPFNLQRENFAPVIEKTDIQALEHYIRLIAAKMGAERSRDIFSKVKTMKRVAGTTRGRADAAAVREFKVKEAAEFVPPQQVVIENGKVTEDGELVIDIAKAREEYSGSMQAPEVSFDDIFVDLDQDPKEPLLHNNTNFDPIQWGLDTGHEDAGLMLAKLGTVAADFRDFIAEARALAGRKDRILKGFAGVSIDKGYAGVNLTAPYTGMFINPLYEDFDVRTTTDFIGLIKYTLVHEAAHYEIRGHGVDFVAKEAELFRDIEGMGGLDQFTQALNEIVDQHFDTLQAMREEYGKSGYRNTGDSLEGESIGSPAGPKGPQKPPSQSRRSEGSGDVSGGLRLDPATTPEQQARTDAEIARLDREIASLRAGLNRALLRKQGGLGPEDVLPEDEDPLSDRPGGLYTALQWAKGLEDSLWYREAMLTGMLDNQYLNPFRYTDPATAEQDFEWKVASKHGLEDEFHQKYLFNKIGKVNFELDDLGISIPSVRVAAGLPEDAARRPDILADAQRQWQQLGFRSPYFKAWFGDWEQDPERSSRVVALANAGQVFGVPTAGEHPLVVFHASDAKVKTSRGWEPFTRFEQGDMGFHFGTLRAAHNRGFGGMLEVPDYPDMRNVEPDFVTEAFVDNVPFMKEVREAYFIPTVLNIRNPIIFGEENPGMWVSPRAMLAQMAVEGVSPFSLQEVNRIIQETEQILISANVVSTFEQFRPLREALLAKGFDGMQYINTQEGDISWVAFKPEQIKSLLGNKTFSKSKDFHWEFDFDQAQPDGFGASRMNRLFGRWMPAQFRRSLRWITNLQYKTLQLQQLAHLHPDLTDLAYMNEKNYEFTRRKGSLQAQPDQVLAEWNDLGKENFARVNKFLQTEAEGDTLWFDLVRENNVWVYRPNAMTLQKMEEFGLQPQSPEGEVLGKLILDAKNALLHQTNETELTFKHLLTRRYGGNQAALTAAFTMLTKEIHEIRKRPFFPQGRFGNYVLTVEKKRDGAAGYEVVYREAFESREEWEEAWQKTSSKVKPDERIRKFELTDTEYVMMSLPQDFIEIAVSELGLTEEQRDTLIAITQPVRREKALRSYDQSRLGLKGYSADAMRSFANFTWHNANLLAKLRYRSEFNMAIQGINAKLRDAQFSEDPASLDEVERLTRVKRYMERSRDFIMAPPNEAHMARAFVSIAYLGFNIKTALVNFYGLVTTWSDITSKLGQVEGNKLFLKAVRGMWASVRLTDLNAVKPSDTLSEELQAGLDRAVQDGVLTQSYAYHLAGMANASNLYRLPSRQVLGKMTHKAIDLAMWTFRLAELGARRATFIAQLDIANRQGDLGFDDAYTLAVTATNKLQNDYSLGNRVPFMRGIKTQGGNPMVEGAVPMATIFLSFAQHMAFHAYGGYELGVRRGIRETAKQAGIEPPKLQHPLFGGYTMKIWLLTLLLAGYEGLPGAENLLDLIDMLWKKLKGKPARQEMREMIQAVGVDPVWAARGMGHNVAGFDISRSVGFGRLIPGTDVLNKTQTDINRTIGNMVFDLAGPTGNMISWGLSTFAGDRPIAEGMKRAPGALGNVWNAYTWSQQGLRAPDGGQISFDLETGKLRDLTTVEVFGKALGFNPAIVSQNREILFQQHDLRMYWHSRRDRLLDDMWKASWQRDREAIADVNKAIQEFNREIPDEYKRSLRITPREIFNSRRSRQRSKRATELQLPVQRRYRELYRDVRESFEEP